MKICEAHSGLSALLIEKSNYDGIWISSLTHAAVKGLPDNELIPLDSRVDLVREVGRVSTKPIIVDVDTMGGIEHIPYFVREFEKTGAHAIVIEDKKYPKQNSLLEENKHQLEDVDIFCEKIRVAKSAAKHLKIIARLESLIAKHSMAEALIRAEAYVNAGADMILIHSKQKIDCSEVMEFAKRFREISDTPLVAIPTTYELPEEHPFDIVITANHMLRASLKAMEGFVMGESVELSTVEEIFNKVGH
jgi:2-methylisocitrate lyase-like PEP mutase family enzyme